MQFIDTAYAAEEVHESAPQDQGVLASLGINGQLFTAQLINFAIIACIIWFLILKPLTTKMTERQKMIDEAIENSKKVQENLAKSEEQYLAKLAEAKIEAGAIVERAMAESEKINTAMKTKTKQEIEALVEQAKKNIAIERSEMKSEIKQEAAEMIVSALEKILAEKMTDKKDKELIADMIKKIK